MHGLLPKSLGAADIQRVRISQAPLPEPEAPPVTSDDVVADVADDLFAALARQTRIKFDAIRQMQSIQPLFESVSVPHTRYFQVVRIQHRLK